MTIRISGSAGRQCPVVVNPSDDLAESASGDLGGVVRLAQTDRVQESDPGRAAGLQGAMKEYGQPGTNWSVLRSPRP